MTKTGQDDMNILRRRGSGMRSEIRMVTMVLAAWLLAVIGFQGLVLFLEFTRHGAGLARYTFFNLPLPYWLTGQFLPLWFILLCVIFNVWMDRHAGATPDSALRFRVRSDRDGEE